MGERNLEALQNIWSEITEANEKGLSYEGKTQVIEKAMLKESQVPCPVFHRFGPGIYMREVTIPAGSFAVGHYQNFEHTNVFLKGRVSMLNDDGSFTELKAPMTFVGKPGRKIGYVHEDMTWINVYATEERDIEKLEAHFLTKSDTWKEGTKGKQVFDALRVKADQDDFKEVIKDSGFTMEEVEAQVKNTDDMIDLPFGDYKIKLGPSPIHGKGLFATADIEEGEIIAPARIDGFRTIAGRFTNHSKEPNAKMVIGAHGLIHLVATKDILGCHGGLDGEEILVNYREALETNFQSRGL